MFFFSNFIITILISIYSKDYRDENEQWDTGKHILIVHER